MLTSETILGGIVHIEIYLDDVLCHSNLLSEVVKSLEAFLPTVLLSKIIDVFLSLLLSLKELNNTEFNHNKQWNLPIVVVVLSTFIALIDVYDIPVS